MTKDWTDIASLHAGYKSGKFKPSQVAQYYLDRIKKVNPTLNAYITVTETQALDRARQLDGQTDRVQPYPPLFGVPVAFKDLFMTKGVKTTAGSKVLENYISEYDATVVKKILDAGAVCLGKLNCDAWAHGSSGENSDFGPTRNPWNIDYVPGGSSSGSAAAVAADLCMVATATDTGGSIRNPASFCSVVGLKPTYGRVSRYGIVAMASSLDSIGHISSSVFDSARVLTVTAGFDPHDATSSHQPVDDYFSFDTLKNKSLKIGIPREYRAHDPQVQKTFETACKIWRGLGADLVDVSLPHTDAALACYYIIQPAEVSSNLARYDGIRFGRDRTAFGAEAKRRIMLGTYTLSAGYYDAYYKTAQKVRTLVVKDFSQAFEKVDLIAGPVGPNLPFKIGEKISDPLSLYLEDVLTVPVNLAGLPAISLPAGFSDTGLPIGVQLVGPQFNEKQLFAVAFAYEQNTDHQQKRPQI